MSISCVIIVLKFFYFQYVVLMLLVALLAIAAAVIGMVTRNMVSKHLSLGGAFCFTGVKLCLGAAKLSK